MDCEISGMILRSMNRRSIQRRIIDGLPGGPYAGDGAGREKILPGSNATLPPSALGSPTHSG